MCFNQTYSVNKLATLLHIIRLNHHYLMLLQKNSVLTTQCLVKSIQFLFLFCFLFFKLFLHEFFPDYFELLFRFIFIFPNVQLNLLCQC